MREHEREGTREKESTGAINGTGVCIMSVPPQNFYRESYRDRIYEAVMMNNCCCFQH